MTHSFSYLRALVQLNTSAHLPLGSLKSPTPSLLDESGQRGWSRGSWTALIAGCHPSHQIVAPIGGELSVDVPQEAMPGGDLRG